MRSRSRWSARSCSRSRCSGGRAQRRARALDLVAQPLPERDERRPVAQSRRVDELVRARGLELDGERHDTLPEASFDAAISRVGLISFPDQQRALAGIRRAVKPGGRFAAVVYSTPDRNAFFSLPVGIIRRRAQLPPPLPGQPGPFSLGAEGVLAKALQQAGFRDVEVRKVDSPVRLPSAAECARFERESFGALHQMMAAMSERERVDTWKEIEAALGKFETEQGFVGPCEMLVGAGTR